MKIIADNNLCNINLPVANVTAIITHEKCTSHIGNSVQLNVTIILHHKSR